MSAARAFLRPAMKRSNVRVETNALATKILFEGSRAVGVEYVQNGKTIGGACRPRSDPVAAARSTRRNCCSCPASARPACSASLGIPVVSDNANVGANLQDHHVGINYTWKARVPTLNQLLRPWWGKLAGRHALLCCCATGRCR